MAFINRHLTEPLTLESIAAEFYLNKDYLGRLFKEHTHATIGHYISVQRANLAQTMLSPRYRNFSASPAMPISLNFSKK